jgi:hypothetical protein
MKNEDSPSRTKEFAAEAGRALRRAARVARQTARACGTPIYVWKNANLRCFPFNRNWRFTETCHLNQAGAIFLF